MHGKLRGKISSVYINAKAALYRNKAPSVVDVI